MRYLILFVLLMSCSSEKRQEPDRYFSLKNYFTRKADEFTSAKKYMDKSIRRGNAVESHSFKEVNWLKEFQPFIDCDINKPSWRNSFSIDSITSGKDVTIRYRALEDLPVRNITIAFYDNEVKSLSVQRSKKNVYYEMSDEYEYMQSGYTIKGNQKVRFMKPDSFTVTASFK